MRISKTDILYFILPVILWPIVFIALRSLFVYAMLIASAILAAFTLLRYRKYVKFRNRKTGYALLIILGIVGSVMLYLVFFGGYYLTVMLGLNRYVSSVYVMLYSQGSKLIVAPMLLVIGISEEIYWRGGVQGYLRGSKMFSKMPWLGSTLYYAGVHLLTLNPVLALAAFFVGLITSLIAERYGIIASAVSHVIWLEAITLLIPIGA